MFTKKKVYKTWNDGRTEEWKDERMGSWKNGKLEKNKSKFTITNIPRGSCKSHFLRHSGESRPAKAGQNRLNPAFGGTGFRVALRPVHHAVQGFACPE
jgi:hypothetical protein